MHRSPRKVNAEAVNTTTDNQVLCQGRALAAQVCCAPSMHAAHTAASRASGGPWTTAGSVPSTG
jgi:hypothetical protein